MHITPEDFDNYATFHVIHNYPRVILKTIYRFITDNMSKEPMDSLFDNSSVMSPTCVLLIAEAVHAKHQETYDHDCMDTYMQELMYIAEANYKSVLNEFLMRIVRNAYMNEDVLSSMENVLRTRWYKQLYQEFGVLKFGELNDE